MRINYRYSFCGLSFCLLLSYVPLRAQGLTADTSLPQVELSRFGVPAGNYSGITWLGGDDYAVVSDKSSDGFFRMRLTMDLATGKLTSAQYLGFCGNLSIDSVAVHTTAGDLEDIVYHEATHTFFLSDEGSQQIVEYDSTGHRTGRRLNIPTIYSRERIVPNYGFEALAYDHEHGLFWATTESMLPIDGRAASPLNRVQNKLRLQAFDEQLESCGQYAYAMDVPTCDRAVRHYAFGVSAITAMADGSLLVLEREACETKGVFGSYVRVKIYRVVPASAKPISIDTSLSLLPEEAYLKKELVTSFVTHIKPLSYNWANYEGICLGPKLNDGRQALVLISDSQGGYGNKIFRLKDYVKVLLINLK